MKIFHITETLTPIGGVETYLIDLLPLLEERGHKNVVVYRKQTPRTPSINTLSTYHVPFTNYPENERAKIKGIIQTEKPSIIYLHTVSDPRVIELANSLAPTIGYIHIFYPVCPGLAKLHRIGDQICTRPFGLGCVPMIYLRRCASARHPRSVYRIMQSTRRYLDAYRALPCIIVASKYMKALMIQNGVDEKRVQILPYFVPIPDDSDIMFPDPGNKNVLFAGRLDYEKGSPFLLRAFKMMPDTYNMIIAGDGSLKQKYVQLVRDHGISERVQFTGWLSDGELQTAYQNCRVAVMPTIMPEPFGKVGVEAMANVRPVVAFDVGGISDWLKHDCNGFLVPPRDVGQLAIRIRQLVDDIELTMKFGRNGRNFAKQHYSAEVHLENLLDIFESTIG
ncbi:MAG: glycosyltransferase family 4 protein [Anaerolineales bacterium]|jgi:glycosyltransferase involved in cell wall biosynthesis